MLPGRRARLNRTRDGAVASHRCWNDDDSGGRGVVGQQLRRTSAIGYAFAENPADRVWTFLRRPSFSRLRLGL